MVPRGWGFGPSANTEASIRRCALENDDAMRVIEDARGSSRVGIRPLRKKLRPALVAASYEEDARGSSRLGIRPLCKQ